MPKAMPAITSTFEDRHSINVLDTEDDRPEVMLDFEDRGNGRPALRLFDLSTGEVIGL